MIIESGSLTQLFDSISHLTVISISKPDWWSARICLLQTIQCIKKRNEHNTTDRRTCIEFNLFCFSLVLTVMLPMISNCRPAGPTNLHITSSTVAVCTWNRSWFLGNVDSITLISCFNTFRQAIVSHTSTPGRAIKTIYFPNIDRVTGRTWSWTMSGSLIQQ